MRSNPLTSPPLRYPHSYGRINGEVLVLRISFLRRLSANCANDLHQGRRTCARSNADLCSSLRRVLSNSIPACWSFRPSSALSRNRLRTRWSEAKPR
jgi:hypothetical protein